MTQAKQRLRTQQRNAHFEAVASFRSGQAAGATDLSRRSPALMFMHHISATPIVAAVYDPVPTRHHLTAHADKSPG
eukprot:1034639-Prymnesium_polylepis.1